MSDPNKLTQPLRELIEKWRGMSKNNIYFWMWHDRADELSALLPSIDREIEAHDAELRRRWEGEK